MKPAAILIVLPLVVWAGPIYTVTALGTLGTESSAYRINNSGRAIGWSRTVSGENHAVLFQAGGGLTDLGASGKNSSASGINDAGNISGTVYSSAPQATVWSPNAAAVGTADSYGLDIASNGDMTGSAGGRAVRWSQGSAEDLGTLAGGTWSAGYALNEQGQVAGYADRSDGSFHAFLWSTSSGMLDLGTLGGGNSYAMDLNGAGQVVGNSTIAGGETHAFLYSGGQLHDLGTLGGGSYAYGINEWGQIVGYSWAGGVQRAVLWYGGAAIDLNSLVTPDSGWQLEAAYGINELGQIVGTGTYRGQSQAFRLDARQLEAFGERGGVAAVPEPGAASLALAGCVVLGLLWMRQRLSSPA